MPSLQLEWLHSRDWFLLFCLTCCVAVNRHSNCELFKAQTEQTVLTDAARELFCCLGLFMYMLYMFMYTLYILRLELLLPKAHFSKTKKIPKMG